MATTCGNTQASLLLDGFTAPAYAILSHIWAEEEVSFTDLQDVEKAKGQRGWEKIACACRQALTDGLTLIWADVCCIDKSSSAELSEAINSMFTWYQSAAVCYVLLADFKVSVMLRDDMPGIERWLDSSDVKTEDEMETTDEIGFYAVVAGAWKTDDTVESLNRFRACKWWTRGWTLQELLAPGVVQFYDQDWRHTGRLFDMLAIVSQIARIETGVLFHTTPLWEVNVATRMSWASQRMTTRPEDEAYCLLGIFDINMPMLYGEGSRAFARLQEEIMKVSTDLSIFAWDLHEDNPDVSMVHRAINDGRLFAPSPAGFRWRHTVFRDLGHHHTASYVPTNAGLRVHLPVLQGDTAPIWEVYGQEEFGQSRRYFSNYSQSHILADLGCRVGSSNELCIMLRLRDIPYPGIIAGTAMEKVYRVHAVERDGRPRRLVLMTPHALPRCVQQPLLIARDRPSRGAAYFPQKKWFSLEVPQPFACSVVKLEPPALWNTRTLIMVPHWTFKQSGVECADVQGAALLSIPGGETVALAFSHDTFHSRWLEYTDKDEEGRNTALIVAREGNLVHRYTAGLFPDSTLAAACEKIRPFGIGGVNPRMTVDESDCRSCFYEYKTNRIGLHMERCGDHTRLRVSVWSC